MMQVPNSLKKQLAEKKTEIVSKWFHSLCQEYPDRTLKLLESNKSLFANPVGYNLHQGLDGIFEQVIEDVGAEKLHLDLDKILRIKAVQDFSPSQTIAFIFVLKKLIREEFRSQLSEKEMYKELVVVEQRIDDIALAAFDVYSRCREAIYQLRIDEVKKRCSILERVNLLNQGPAATQHIDKTQ